MKKLTLAASIFLVSASSCFGETSMSLGSASFALKEGFTWFDEHRASKYEGNNIYDSEFGPGAYVRYEKSGYFARLDYDTLRTGNTFESDTAPTPYEAVHVRLHSLTGTVGKRLPYGFYAGAGGGIGLNKWKILTFDIHPITLGYDPTLILHALAGYERRVYKNVFAFIEGRALWERQDITLHEYRKHEDEKVFVRDTNLNENLSRVSVFTGLGIEF